jgi:hypothetical protein
MTMCVCCAAMHEQSNAHQPDESNNAQQADAQTSDEVLKILEVRTLVLIQGDVEIQVHGGLQRRDPVG